MNEEQKRMLPFLYGIVLGVLFMVSVQRFGFVGIQQTELEMKYQILWQKHQNLVETMKTFLNEPWAFENGK